MENKRVQLSSEEIKNLNCTALNIDSLPEEMFLKVFGYLKYEDLCRVGRVCKKWRAITSYPVYWRRVDIQFSRKCKSLSKTAMKFISILPSCVTHLKLNFDYRRNWSLKFTELLLKLKERCPNLQVLIFHRARLTDCSSSRTNLSEDILANVRVLVVHHSVLKDHMKFTITDEVNSKIEVFDASRTTEMPSNFEFLSNLPNLKNILLSGTGVCDGYIFQTNPSVLSNLEVLDLEDTLTGYRVFKAVRHYGLHLVELYMCFTLLRDEDLDIDDVENPLPCLKTVCLRASNVTHRGITSLIKSCPSLQHIYAGDLLPYSTNDYASCKSDKVKVIHGFEYCDHYAKVDYLHA